MRTLIHITLLWLLMSSATGAAWSACARSRRRSSRTQKRRLVRKRSERIPGAPSPARDASRSGVLALTASRASRRRRRLSQIDG